MRRERSRQASPSCLTCLALRNGKTATRLCNEGPDPTPRRADPCFTVIQVHHMMDSNDRSPFRKATRRRTPVRNQKALKMRNSKPRDDIKRDDCITEQQKLDYSEMMYRRWKNLPHRLETLRHSGFRTISDADRRLAPSGISHRCCKKRT